MARDNCDWCGTGGRRGIDTADAGEAVRQPIGIATDRRRASASSVVRPRGERADARWPALPVSWSVLLLDRRCRTGSGDLANAADFELRNVDLVAPECLVRLARRRRCCGLRLHVSGFRVNPTGHFHPL